MLVCGTLVYSKGDEEGVQREAAEALAVQVRGGLRKNLVM